MLRRLTALLAAPLVVLAGACRDGTPERAEPDPVALFIVNTTEYHYGELEPVHYAYTEVAEWLNWDPADIEKRRAWLVENVIARESGGCWMILGGTLYDTIGQPCFEPSVRGRREDAGFGQVTSAGWGRNGIVCKQLGLCSRHAVISSAWNSMAAMLVLYQEAGEFPWCWDADARAYHDCHLAP